MIINISGKHVNVGDSLKNYITDELKKVVSKYFGEGTDCSAILSPKPHNKFGVEIIVNIGHGIRLKSQAEADDAYATSDSAIAKIAKQLKRYKERLKDHHKAQAERYELETHAFEYTLSDEDKEPAEAIDTFETSDGQAMVIAEETTTIPNITVKEAAMRLDLEDSNVILFKNEATENFNVVYRRTDGNIGWLEPKNK